MDLTGMLMFALALMAVTAAPGPLVAVIVTRALGCDLNGALSFAAGVCVGDMFAILAIALGIGDLMQAGAEWLMMLKFCGVGYLLWLAVQMWRESDGGIGASLPQHSGIASFGAGIALCLGNPATFVFYLLLLPSVSPQGISDAGVLVPILLVSLMAVGASLAGMILMAAQLRRVLVSQSANRVFGRTMSLLMAAVACSMLLV